MFVALWMFLSGSHACSFTLRAILSQGRYWSVLGLSWAFFGRLGALFGGLLARSRRRWTFGPFLGRSGPWDSWATLELLGRSLALLVLMDPTWATLGVTLVPSKPVTNRFGSIGALPAPPPFPGTQHNWHGAANAVNYQQRSH